jgi:hypothetical protein
MMQLSQWQTTEKLRSEILYNCSEFDRMNDEWVSFPIGIGWTIINYNNPLSTIQIGNHEKLVHCGISVTTDQRRRGSTPLCRKRFVETLAMNGIHNTLTPSSSYFSTLPSYKFVISPEGNGIDCHRHYEALMAGCIPIIEDHDGIRKKYEGCPILYTKDYSEITHEYLEQVYTKMKDTTYDFSCLLMSSYSVEDQAQIKHNGIFWSKKLSGRSWY